MPASNTPALNHQNLNANEKCIEFNKKGVKVSMSYAGIFTASVTSIILISSFTLLLLSLAMLKGYKSMESDWKSQGLELALVEANPNGTNTTKAVLPINNQ